MHTRTVSPFTRLLPAVLWLLPLPGHALQVEIPLRLEQAFLQRALADQVYSDGDGLARVWDDGRDCNSLVLSSPELAIENGQLRTMTAARTRVGTVLGESCLPVIHWTGYIEILQEPVLGDLPGVVEFRVVDSKIYAEDGKSPGVLGVLWGWTRNLVQPRFSRLRVDLNPVLNELREFLALVFPLQAEGIGQALDTVALHSVALTDDRLQLGIRIEVPEPPPAAVSIEPEPALTEEELARWTEAWQRWDAFLTSVTKHAGADTEQVELRAALLGVLLDARQDLLEVLSPPAPGAPDPVPALFVQSWERLAPVLRRLGETLPADSALNYLSFIAAADALEAIHAVESETGLILTADALRRLARMIVPAEAPDPLYYDRAVDPELRELFGFGPPLALPDTGPAPIDPQEADSLALHGALFLPARQAIGGMPAALLLPVLPTLIVRNSSYLTLVERLNGRVPTLGVLDEYLSLVKQLLDHVADVTSREKKLDRQFRDIFRPLVLSTAWQESCWRQFIRVKGEVRPIRSHAGAVGIMQINQHVWRGFYDVDGLQHNVGYNAEAGSEILHHYLVDYAIAKGEHTLAGGNDNLPRATYAMYNGGPKHMTRYRRKPDSSSLNAIDKAFWEKFQTVRSGDALAVAGCYRD